VQNSQLTVKAVTAAVAGRVRGLRTARGWSLDELAGRSGVSKGMVVQVEAGRTNPSIGTLCRLADAFGVTIAELLEPATPRRVQVRTNEEAPVLWQGVAGGTARLLAGLSQASFVELWEWRVEPGEEHQSPDHTPGCREIVHVLSGSLVVTVDGTEYVVRGGQTIEFLADQAHAYRNDGRKTCHMAMVVAMPPGEHDRR
jgi:quercetin dioxygenase-like cupin family protein/DNA-binding XRE family transcriptional regulator